MVFSRQMLATMLRRSGVLQSRVLGSVITLGLVCLTSFVATLAGGASDFFQAVAGYKAPSVRCLQLQVLGSTVLFCFLPSVVILIRLATDFRRGFPQQSSVKEKDNRSHI